MCDGVVGIEIADAFGDGLRRQLLEDFLAHRVVDLGQRGEVEIAAQQFDEAAAAARDRAPRSDRRCRTRAGRRPDRVRPAASRGVDPARDAFDEGLADRAVLVARQLRSLGRLGLVLIEHYEAVDNRLKRDACTPFPTRGAND